jgi:protein SCO1
MRDLIKTLILLTALLWMVGCKTQQPSKPEFTPSPVASATPEAAVSPCCSEDEGTGALPGMSIYNLESAWLDTSGEEIRLSEFRGNAVVVAMVYSSCKAACPRIIDDMGKIRAGLDSADGVRFVLVSIDPEVDTPEKLKQYAAENNLGDWEFLHGDNQDVLELAMLLGVKYRKTSETDYAHSNVISVLDKEGEVVHQQEGLGVYPQETIKIIKDLPGG